MANKTAVEQKKKGGLKKKTEVIKTVSSIPIVESPVVKIETETKSKAKVVSSSDIKTNETKSKSTLPKTAVPVPVILPVPVLSTIPVSRTVSMRIKCGPTFLNLVKSLD